MFWLWHKDRLLSYFVQKNSEFTPFSWDRKKYWYQGWIAYLKYFWIICRINWLKGWNNFSKVFFCHIVLFITFYKTYLSNYLLCLCLAEILFEDTSVAFISSWRYTVLLPVIRWLPEDGDGSQVYHCVYLWEEASASVSGLIKKSPGRSPLAGTRLFSFCLKLLFLGRSLFFFFSVLWQTTILWK